MSVSKNQAQLASLPTTLNHYFPRQEIACIAKKTGFQIRKHRKMHPATFLSGWLQASFQARPTLTSVATVIACTLNGLLAKQTLAERIGSRAVSFFQCLIQELIRKQSSESLLPNQSPLNSFRRILIHDSTTLKLPTHLHAFYPGNCNQTHKTSAILKIQTVYELLSGSFIHFSITAFRRTEQTASSDILPLIQRNDLMIRDLGYFVQSVLQKVHKQGAFFVSRLKANTKIFTYQNNTLQPMKLLKTLKKKKYLDQVVYIGAKTPFPCRLIALPVAQHVANQRRRKAKCDRDKRLHHSNEYLTLLGWNIFITNLDQNRFQAKTVAQMYAHRGAIEIIFKSWKSNFQIGKIPKASKLYTDLFIHAHLLAILMAFAFLHKLQRYTKKQALPPITILKTTKFLIENIHLVFQVEINQQHQNQMLAMILYYCSYDKRKRKNLWQKATFLT